MRPQYLQILSKKENKNRGILVLWEMLDEVAVGYMEVCCITFTFILFY